MEDKGDPIHIDLTSLPESTVLLPKDGHKAPGGAGSSERRAEPAPEAQGSKRGAGRRVEDDRLSPSVCAAQSGVRESEADTEA